jgi:hypothetical protein
MSRAAHQLPGAVGRIGRLIRRRTAIVPGDQPLIWRMSAWTFGSHRAGRFWGQAILGRAHRNYVPRRAEATRGATDRLTDWVCVCAEPLLSGEVRRSGGSAAPGSPQLHRDSQEAMRVPRKGVDGLVARQARSIAPAGINSPLEKSSTYKEERQNRAERCARTAIPDYGSLIGPPD